MCYIILSKATRVMMITFFFFYQMVLAVCEAATTTVDPCQAEAVAAHLTSGPARAGCYCRKNGPAAIAEKTNTHSLLKYKLFIYF